MKIAVLGSQGQLGRDLCPRLAGEVLPLTRADIDLAQPATIAPTLARPRPDVVVNCAAYNFVDKADTDLAAAVAGLVADSTEGLVHATSSGDCTWYEFAAEIFRLASVRADLTPTTSEQFNAPARRPPYSVLNSDRIPSLRPWQEAVAAY